MISEEAQGRAERALTWILAIALVVAVAGVVYVAVNPPETTDPYTEFYVLGPDGETADGYPENLTVGETGEVVVGITNHEHKEMTYTVAVVVEDEVRSKRTVSVDDESTWEDRFGYTPESAGEKRVRILLYKGETVNLDEEPYRHLRLLVSVENGTAS